MAWPMARSPTPPTRSWPCPSTPREPEFSWNKTACANCWPSSALLDRPPPLRATPLPPKLSATALSSTERKDPMGNMHVEFARDLMKHMPEFRRAFQGHKYEFTEDGGILFPAQKAICHGLFIHSVNGEDERSDKNMWVTEGRNHALDVVFGAGTQATSWYLALFTGDVSVASTWTAANFAANATENTSTAEGYTNSTRPAWTKDAAASSGSITNNASNKINYTFATASTVTVRGAGFLTTNTRGGTSGVLMSASRFSADRAMANSDILSVGYLAVLFGVPLFEPVDRLFLLRVRHQAVVLLEPLGPCGLSLCFRGVGHEGGGTGQSGGA